MGKTLNGCMSWERKDLGSALSRCSLRPACGREDAGKLLEREGICPAAG